MYHTLSALTSFSVDNLAGNRHSYSNNLQNSSSPTFTPISSSACDPLAVTVLSRASLLQLHNGSHPLFIINSLILLLIPTTNVRFRCSGDNFHPASSCNCITYKLSVNLRSRNASSSPPPDHPLPRQPQYAGALEQIWPRIHIYGAIRKACTKSFLGGMVRRYFRSGILAFSLKLMVSQVIEEEFAFSDSLEEDDGMGAFSFVRRSYNDLEGKVRLFRFYLDRHYQFLIRPFDTRRATFAFCPKATVCMKRRAAVRNFLPI